MGAGNLEIKNRNIDSYERFSRQPKIKSSTLDLIELFYIGKIWCRKKWKKISFIFLSSVCMVLLAIGEFYDKLLQATNIKCNITIIVKNK